MKRILAAAATLGSFALAGAALAQTDVRVETRTKQTGPGPNVKVKKEITIGRVKEYEAGRKIRIAGPHDKTYSFDLDENARVDGAIAVGQRVRVEWVKDDNGRQRVTVLSGPGSTRGAAETAMLEKQTEGHATHSKSETIVRRPGADLKTTSETVIGTVKEYEPGRKIKVTGPKDKDVSFSLDDAVQVQGNVAVGSRVKVEYTKSNDGTERVKVVSLAPEKGKKGS